MDQYPGKSRLGSTSRALRPIWFTAVLFAEQLCFVLLGKRQVVAVGLGHRNRQRHVEHSSSLQTCRRGWNTFPLCLTSASTT